MRVDDIDDPADAVLRSIFAREAQRVPVGGDAQSALLAMQPALRRAAMRRAMVTLAVVTVGAGGAAGLVRAVQVPPGAATIDVRPTPTETLPPVIDIEPVRPDGGPLVDPSPTAAPGSSDESDAAPRSRVVVDGSDRAVPTTTVATAPPPAPQAEPAPAATPNPTPTPAPAAPAPVELPATTPPTSRPTPTEFASECGTVVADLATDPPVIIEVRAGEGYEIVVEPADHGTVVVHLVGRRHACEIHVGDDGHDGADDDAHDGDERSSARPDDDDD